MSKADKTSPRLLADFALAPIMLCAKKKLSQRELFLDCGVLLIKIGVIESHLVRQWRVLKGKDEHSVAGVRWLLRFLAGPAGPDIL
jgi:hypothetical protein